MTVLAAVLVGGAQQAQAQSAQSTAEAYRMEQELQRLAQRGAWTGVESRYQAILDLGVDPSHAAHLTAAQAAGVLGKTWERYQRLERALALEETQEIVDNLAAIDAGYGRVRLNGSPRWEVRFSRPSMPFAPDQRKSVEYGVYVLENGGSFEGMLPAGTYMLGSDDTKTVLEFVVEPGADWQEIPILRDYAAGGEGIVYHGPIASLGYAFTGTGAPGLPVLVPGTTVHSAQPDKVTGSGLGVELGYEIGPSRLLAAAMSVSYSNLIGSEDTWHAGAGWLQAVVRPGDARFAVGPTYGVISGKGRGVPDWFDVGQDLTQIQNENIRYHGHAWAAGVRASAGYGLLDFDPLQGVVELDGAWQTDGARSYFAFGLRVGIVPKVPRFKG